MQRLLVSVVVFCSFLARAQTNAPWSTTLGDHVSGWWQIGRLTDHGFPNSQYSTVPANAAALWFHRATADTTGANDFLVSPYVYGMHFEYPGTTEWSVSCFSIQRPFMGRSPYLLLGNEFDTGGLHLQAFEARGYAEIAVAHYDGSSDGDLNVRFPASTNRVNITQGPSGVTLPAVASLGADGSISGNRFLLGTNVLTAVGTNLFWNGVKISP